MLDPNRSRFAPSRHRNALGQLSLLLLLVTNALLLVRCTAASHLSVHTRLQLRRVAA